MPAVTWWFEARSDELADYEDQLDPNYIVF
jgi:hypothetical protein